MRCKRLAVAVLDSCEGANEVRLLLKEEAAAKKFFSHVFLYRDAIQFIINSKSFFMQLFETS